MRSYGNDMERTLYDNSCWILTLDGRSTVALRQCVSEISTEYLSNDGGHQYSTECEVVSEFSHIIKAERVLHDVDILA